MEAKPLVSIIVPIYNVEKYLPRCIDSILLQDYPNIEIWLVDDGSPDGCPAICDEYAKRDKRIKVIHKPNGGQSDARNAALDVAKGEFITFIDSDDYVSKDYVSTLFKLLKSYDADIAQCEWQEYNDFLAIPKQTQTGGKIKQFDKTEAIKNVFYQKTLSASACLKLYRRSIFQNLRFPLGTLYEDLATVYPAFNNSKRIVHTSGKLYYYYQRPGSTLHVFNEKRTVVIKILKEILEQIERENPECINAVKSRLLSAAFNMLRLVPKDDKYEDYIKEWWNIIKGLRMKCLFDSNVRIKNKIGIILSFLGRGTLMSFINRNY